LVADLGNGICFEFGMMVGGAAVLASGSGVGGIAVLACGSGFGADMGWEAGFCAAALSGRISASGLS
jgi:hypothetical protein